MEKKDQPQDMDSGAVRRQKKKYRRNFVDVLVILLVVLSVSAFFFRGKLEDFVNRTLADDSTTVRFAVTELSPELAELFGTEKNFVYDSGDFGRLQNYEVRVASDYLLRPLTLGDSTQTVVEKVNDPERRVVEGSFLIEGLQKESGFYLSGTTKIAVGMTFDIYAKGQKYTILITQIG